MTAEANWQASWIWYPGARRTVNYHFLARKSFSLEAPPLQATLHISAYTGYQVYVNGAFVGRGPAPCDPCYQSYDSYDVTGHLRAGVNVIAVIARNRGIGVHWQHRGPGGLICQLDADTAKGPIPKGTGSSICIVSDGTWKLKPGAAWSLNSPRMFWSADFMESFDCRVYDAGWLDPEFDDNGWDVPEVIGSHPTRPWIRLVPREIPFLTERPAAPVAAERGSFSLQGVHTVSFGRLLAPGEAGIVYAQTSFHVGAERDLILHIECDDALKAFVGGELVLEQNYNEEFARARVWRGQDEYEQAHYGMPGSLRPLKASVRLKRGWNEVTVVVDQGPGGWGFGLAWLDPASQAPIAFDFAANPTPSAQTWLITGPFETTGMSDSLDHVAASIPGVAEATSLAVDPYDHGTVTDYAMLMRYEQRGDVQTVEPGQKMVLQAGEFAIFDLGAVAVCYPELCVVSPEGGDAVLDVGYSQVFFENRQIRFSNSGMLKYVDRVYLRDGPQRWQPFERRTARFLHISCRKGERIELSYAGVRATGYPVEERGSFRCSDPLLNRIWEVSRYTTALLMQYGYQDCLKREQGTLNCSSFNFTSRSAACAFGDYALARKTLRLAIQTQHDDGWFDSHGISSPNSDEFTQCLMWIVWLRDYWLYSGDLAFVREVFESTEDALRYFSKMANRHGLLDTRNYPVLRQGHLIYLDDVLGYSQDPKINEPYRSDFRGEILGFNILFYGALNAARQLAEELGLTDRAEFYRRKAERVRTACRERFWDASRDFLAEWRRDGELSAACHPVVQITALYYDICDEHERARLLDYLVNDLGLPSEDNPDYPLSTFGYYYYFLEVLFCNGHAAMALDLMRTYYGRWLAAGATTFGEHYHMSWLRGKQRLDFEYEVHAYGTSAHLHFYNNILGIRPLEPGFRRALIAPHPGDLEWAEGQIPTPLGTIQVSWKVIGSAFVMDVEAPEACVCEVVPPENWADCQVVRINGKVVAKAAHMPRFASRS